MRILKHSRWECKWYSHYKGQYGISKKKKKKKKVELPYGPAILLAVSTMNWNQGQEEIFVHMYS